MVSISLVLGTMEKVSQAVAHSPTVHMRYHEHRYFYVEGYCRSCTHFRYLMRGTQKVVNYYIARFKQVQQSRSEYLLMALSDSGPVGFNTGL